MRGVWVQNGPGALRVRRFHSTISTSSACQNGADALRAWRLLLEKSAHGKLGAPCGHGALGNLGAVRGLCAPWTLRCIAGPLCVVETAVWHGRLAASFELRCTAESSLHFGKLGAPLDHFFIERWSRSASSFEKCTEVDGTHQKVRRCTEAPKVCRVWRGVSKFERHIDAHWALRLGVEYRG